MLAIQEGTYIFCLGMYNLNETFIYRPKSTLLTSSSWTCVSDSLALSLSALSNFTGQAATKNDFMLSPNEGIAPFSVTSSPGFVSSPQGDVTSWYTPIPIDAPRAAKTAFSEPDIRCGGRFRPWGYRGGIFLVRQRIRSNKCACHSLRQLLYEYSTIKTLASLRDLPTRMASGCCKASDFSIYFSLSESIGIGYRMSICIGMLSLALS